MIHRSQYAHDVAIPFITNKSILLSSFRDLSNEKCCSFNNTIIYECMLPLIAGFGNAFVIIHLLARKSNLCLLVCVVIAILLNLIASMFYLKMKESLLVTDYAFIFGPVIGYMLVIVRSKHSY